MSTTRKSFARPANVTQYTAGDLVANSATAGSVLPLLLTPVRTIRSALRIRRLRLTKTGVSVTAAAFRVHLFDTAPVTVTNGDNGVLSVSGSASYLGSADITVGQAFTDGATGAATVDIPVVLRVGKAIYALIEARDTYTPVSGETFSLSIDHDEL